uniref:CCHC-type domain-containing protein n=1 Tax=Naja naja TaxID=35670 RepID=A0A8C6XYR5_NAJNA
MAALNTPPAPFDPVAEDWESYADRFQMYLEGNDLANISEKRKRAVFLTHCGPAVFKMAKALVGAADMKVMEWPDLEKLLRAHYAPQVSCLIKRHEFYRRDQEESENVNDFVASLRDIVGACAFNSLEEAMRDRFVLGLKDKVLQSKLLLKPKITLKEAIEEASSAEATKSSAAAMKKINKASRHPDVEKSTTTHCEQIDSESDCSEVEEGIYRLRMERKKKDLGRKRQDFYCRGCGVGHPCTECKFLDTICLRCKKRGHLARVCKSSRTPPHRRKFPDKDFKPKNFSEKMGRNSEANGKNETHQTVTIGYSSPLRSRKVHVKVLIEGRPCQMEVDSGSYLSMVSWDTIHRLLPNIQKKHFQKQALTL